MSVFSNVDDSDDPDLAVAYLSVTARAASGMKHYALAAHALRQPDGFVLDVGCGAGHDLALLQSKGITAVGVDPSATMLRSAAGRVEAPLVQANGERLPFRSGSIAGCRIERVLVHVPEPSVFLGEVARCLRPGALVTVFEPVWNRFTVREADEDVSAAWLAPVLNPDAGDRLWEWVEQAGCVVLDRVEELSVWRSIDTLERAINLDRATASAIDESRISESTEARWQQRQRERSRRGDFQATIPKVLIVAQRC